MTPHIPRYILKRWKAAVGELFEETEHQDVIDWLIANHRRSRVVLVGAGFSKNAESRDGNGPPLWRDIQSELERDLRLPHRTFDPLATADFYRRNMGENAFHTKMLSLLDDDVFRPGVAHRALWDMNPEAVITTNFLDTLLEDPHRAQVVIEDPDLARIVPEGKRQLIYLHGHRSQFASWIVGRSDYDDLPERRPMLFARTRQLFAQFPLLVVGYSLNDPDFHLLYRQMVRAMAKRHPLGLAVLTDVPEVERSASRRYWDDLGLRLVTLRGQDASDRPEQFRKLFSLTRPVISLAEVEGAFHTAGSEGQLPDALRRNLEVWRDAVSDRELVDIWEIRYGGKASVWKQVLSKAVPPSLHEQSQKKAQTYNQDLTSSRRSEDGSDHRGQEIEPESLNIARWTRAASQGDASVEKVWEMLQNERGIPFVWELNAALHDIGLVEPIAAWLRWVIERPDVLDGLGLEERATLVALMLLKWTDPDVRKLVGKRAAARLQPLAAILGTSEATEPSSPESARLIEARNLLESGSAADAERIYREAARDTAVSTDLGAPLREYFAMIGVCDAIHSREPLRYSSDLQAAHEEVRRKQTRPEVRQWRARIDQLKRSLLRTQVNRLTTLVQLGDREITGISLSNDGWNLNVLLEEAAADGAPTSLLAELTGALLGQLVNLEDELAERLRFDIDKPGKWLAQQVRTGDLFRQPTSGLTRDLKQAGSSERMRKASAVAALLLPQGSISSRHQQALVEVIDAIPESILQSDVPKFLEFLVSRWKTKNDLQTANAICSFAHITAWSTLKDVLLNPPDKHSWLDIRWASRGLPFEHWQTCDSFIDDGGHEFLERISAEYRPIEWPAIGWALVTVLEAASSTATLRPFVIGRVLSAYDNEQVDRDAVWEQLANLYLLTPELRDEPRLKTLTEQALTESNRDFCRILLQSRREHPLMNEASTAFARLGVDENEPELRVFDHALIAFHSGNGALMPEQEAFEHLGTTWKALPSLAPVLHARFWTPEGWRRLLALLQFGGHRGKSVTWAVYRTRLLIDAMRHPDYRRVFNDTDDLNFLRRSPFELLGHGVGDSANQAVYALATLGPHLHSHEHEEFNRALLSSADDVRVNVAHGAAFLARYILARDSEPWTAPLLSTAEAAAARLKDDPFAIVQRQAVFGAAQGRKRASQDQAL